MQIIFHRNQWEWRLFSGHNEEIAYLTAGISGLCAIAEFPSEWHESKRVWVRLGFGLFRVAFSLPWPWAAQDKDQESGPTYGFLFSDGMLHLHWGKCVGQRGDPMKVFRMPWLRQR